MYVRHFCGLQQLRTSSVLLFNLTAIAANKKKMRVLKPTAGSNQRSVLNVIVIKLTYLFERNLKEWIGTYLL